MLHLAQVEKISSSDELALRLLARQNYEYAWTVLLDPDLIPLRDRELGNGSLVLVELSQDRQIQSLEIAQNWVLNIIQTFLISGITPEFLQREAEKIEDWRREHTLISQDLDRRALELEARREQIEQLEENLKREKKHLEAKREEIDDSKKQIEFMIAHHEEQARALDRRTLELESRQLQVERLEESLNHEKKKMEEALAQKELKTNQTN